MLLWDLEYQRLLAKLQQQKRDMKQDKVCFKTFSKYKTTTENKTI